MKNNNKDFKDKGITKKEDIKKISEENVKKQSDTQLSIEEIDNVVGGRSNRYHR